MSDFDDLADKRRERASDIASSTNTLTEDIGGELKALAKATVRRIQ
jgi:hypothetical protein